MSQTFYHRYKILKLFGTTSITYFIADARSPKRNYWRSRASMKTIQRIKINQKTFIKQKSDGNVHGPTFGCQIYSKLLFLLQV
jgi:hypothetical protein